MTRIAQRIRYFVTAVVLCGAATAPLPAQALQIVDMAAQLDTVNGAALQAVDRLIVGHGPTNGDASVASGNAAASVQVTFDTAPIGQYATAITIPSTLQYINDTRWWSKTTAHLHIDFGSPFADVSVETSRTRGAEKYAVYAIAPGSASGFAADAETSAGGGPGIRLLITGYFNGGAVTQHYLDDPGNVPHFSYGASFGDSFGAPPEPDFNSTLLDYNLGNLLVVDLDAVGVAVGDDYTFFEHYRLGLGPGVTLGALEEAFVTIDPVIGYAFAVSEAGTLALVGLGLLGLAGARRRG